MMEVPQSLVTMTDAWKGSEESLSQYSSVQAEAIHFKELFGHLKLSYIEEDSREKYSSRQILSDR